MVRAAADRRNAVLIQLMSTALMAKSRPIVGRATFTDEPMNGPRNDASVATIRAARLAVLSFVETGSPIALSR
jgi:hypothetical protein